MLQLWSYLFAAVGLFVTAVGVGICTWFVLRTGCLFCFFCFFFLFFFSRVLSEIKGRFEPDVVVLQCGADMLSGDPLGSFSLTLRGVGMCATFILQWGIPTLLLGGGW